MRLNIIELRLWLCVSGVFNKEIDEKYLRYINRNHVQFNKIFLMKVYLY